MDKWKSCNGSGAGKEYKKGGGKKCEKTGQKVLDLL